MPTGWWSIHPVGTAAALGRLRWGVSVTPTAVPRRRVPAGAPGGPRLLPHTGERASGGHSLPPPPTSHGLKLHVSAGVWAGSRACRMIDNTRGEYIIVR